MSPPVPPHGAAAVPALPPHCGVRRVRTVPPHGMFVAKVPPHHGVAFAGPPPGCRIGLPCRRTAGHQACDAAAPQVALSAGPPPCG